MFESMFQSIGTAAFLIGGSLGILLYVTGSYAKNNPKQAMDFAMFGKKFFGK